MLFNTWRYGLHARGGLLPGVYNVNLQVDKGLLGFTRKGLQSRSETASLLIKCNKCKEDNRIYWCSGSEKQTHCGSLWEGTDTQKSCGERPRVVGSSGKGRAAHLVRHQVRLGYIAVPSRLDPPAQRVRGGGADTRAEG